MEINRLNQTYTVMGAIAGGKQMQLNGKNWKSKFNNWGANNLQSAALPKHIAAPPKGLGA
jgi:hypothetical protein